MTVPSRETQEAASEIERIRESVRARASGECEPTDPQLRRLEELTRRILSSHPSGADAQAIEALSESHVLIDQIRPTIEARVRAHPNSVLERLLRHRTTMEERKADELLWRLLDDPAADRNVQLNRLEHEFDQIRPLPDPHAKRLAEFVLDAAVKGDGELACAALVALWFCTRSTSPRVLETMLQGSDTRADALLAVLASQRAFLVQRSRAAAWIARNFPGESEPRVSLRRQAVDRQLGH